MDAVNHLLRKSRRSLLAAAHHVPLLPRLDEKDAAALAQRTENETRAAELALAELIGNGGSLLKRLTVDEIQSLQDAAKASAISQASVAAAAVSRLPH